MAVGELGPLLDTMALPERQAATTEVPPLRQQELVSVPEPIDIDPVALGSYDIRTAPVNANTVSRRTAHLPMSVRAPARPGRAVPPAEPPAAKPLAVALAVRLVAPHPVQRAVAPPADSPAEESWAGDQLLLFACWSWSLIAACVLFVLALL